MSPLQVVDEAMADRIFHDVRTHLPGAHGVRRYLGDSFWCADYKALQSPERRTADVSEECRRGTPCSAPVQEAQWCSLRPGAVGHPRPPLRGDRRAGAFWQQQVQHLDRSLCQLTASGQRVPRFLCPELYCLEGGRRVPNDVTPLLWTQANLSIALEQMRKTAGLDHEPFPSSLHSAGTAPRMQRKLHPSEDKRYEQEPFRGGCGSRLFLLPLAGRAQTFTDNASNYKGKYADQGGSTLGFGPFGVASAGSAGTFVFTAGQAEGNRGKPAPSTLDTSGVSFGLFANNNNSSANSSVTITRTFKAPLANTGDVFSLDFVSGYNDAGSVGVALTNAGGTVGSFMFHSRGVGVLFNGASTGVGFIPGASHLVYSITSPTTYSLTVTGADAFTGTGTFSSPITGFQVQQVNAGIDVKRRPQRLLQQPGIETDNALASLRGFHDDGGGGARLLGDHLEGIRADRLTEYEQIDTRYFTRFERVAKITQTDRGLLAEVENELLRIDVIRDDILRVKISRGRTFDEKPTFAVDADLESISPVFTVEEGEQACAPADRPDGVDPLDGPVPARRPPRRRQ